MKGKIRRTINNAPGRSAMIQAIGALCVAALGGLTIIAYRHPKKYQNYISFSLLLFSWLCGQWPHLTLEIIGLSQLSGAQVSLSMTLPQRPLMQSVILKFQTGLWVCCQWRL